MSDTLTDEQLSKLENVLFIHFHNKQIVEEKNEIVPVDNSDAQKIKLFIGSKKVSGRQDSTLKQYTKEIWSCRNALNKPFEEITTMDLRWYLGMLKEVRGCSAVTLQTRRRYLNSFWTFLSNEGIVHGNPVARIEAIKIESKIKKAFSAKDMEALRESCDCLRDRAMIEFMVSTGLRVSELCSLNVGQLDLSKMEFSVIGKGRKERTLYITEKALFHLYQYLHWRCDHEGKTWDELMSQPLFVTNKAPYTRLTPAGVQNIMKRLGKKAGVVNCHPHRMRRTFCTNLLQYMKIEEVMVLMGHSKIDTTLIYADIKQTNVKESFVRAMAA